MVNGVSARHVCHSAILCRYMPVQSNGEGSHKRQGLKAPSPRPPKGCGVGGHKTRTCKTTPPSLQMHQANTHTMAAVHVERTRARRLERMLKLSRPSPTKVSSKRSSTTNPTKTQDGATGYMRCSMRPYIWKCTWSCGHRKHQDQMLVSLHGRTTRQKRGRQHQATTLWCAPTFVTSTWRKHPGKSQLYTTELHRCINHGNARSGSSGYAPHQYKYPTRGGTRSPHPTTLQLDCRTRSSTHTLHVRTVSCTTHGIHIYPNRDSTALCPEGVTNTGGGACLTLRRIETHW